MRRYGELKRIIHFKLLDWVPDAHTRRHICCYLASDRDTDLLLSGSAQEKLHNIQVEAVHRVWERLLLGKGPYVYIGNDLRLTTDASDSDFESDDGVLSAHHNYTILLWKAHLSRTPGDDESEYENRPLKIVIRFLGKPPFAEAPRR